jgi:hypothetical protein
LAVWEVKLVFQYGDRFWENVFHVDTGSAADVDPTVIDALRGFAVGPLLTIYELVKIVRRPAGSHDAFIESIFNLAGSRAIGSSHPLPLWNCVRLIMLVAAGRPGLKYLRGILIAADIIDSANTIDPSLLAGITTGFNSVISAATTAGQTFVKGADVPIASVSSQLKAQMRQLHRKRKHALP